ncbi:reverse transcriptase family protein [Sphingomonas nostoxanthinifaciens]|uniref:reverse transcriptase family protein n=1 Tax=Sphingomonas nostoxanthinifaciens TaxID=2872652 RepID=UPI001CC1F000|nr:reverse transcriptase family protein [Sphingomonas nostoxanthinifaciens]UAK23842.1 reverse transcriptase family protein [Sphingomonas nostoxanthinifaciens]
MARRCAKRVSLRGSALFKLTSPARLAHILCISPGQLAYLVRNAEANYLVRTDRKTGRLIEEPKALLKQVHARVAKLLQQIETPDYLHSGVRQRSYVTNASQHGAKDSAVKLDIKKFFPSVRAAAVYSFFHELMEYPADVASRMTRLLTIGGHLPTGGNASCILSFWAYKPMFDEIAELAVAKSCAFTLYVDDMTISGRFASRSMQQAARQIVGRHRLRAHKNKVFVPNQPRVVTGVAVTVRGLELPNRRAKAIDDATQVVTHTADGSAKLALLPVLIGRVSEAAEIDPAWNGRKTAAVNLRRTLTGRIATASRPGGGEPPA